MTVKLNVQANVTGQQQLAKLNNGLRVLGTQASVAKKRLQGLEIAAARSKATFAALGTTLKVGVGVGLAAVTVGIGKFVKDTFAAGKLTESLQVRFKLLFNSAKEGAEAFKVMNKFAARVPFSLEAIAAGSGNLAVISKDADELNKILEVTGNVAAATGLDFAQTATQIQRSFAGGIASADIFRERGVRAMLGFEAGAKVSIEETRKRFFEVFANGGQYSKATKEFENTLEAQVSFVGDAYFRIRQAAAKPLFAGVKAQLIELVGNFKKNDKELKVLAKQIGQGLADGFKKLGQFIKFVVNNFDLLTKVVKGFIGVKVGTFIAGVASQLIIMANAAKIAGGAWTALNIAIRANPIGLAVTAIQIAVTAIFIFNKEIMNLVNGALKMLSKGLKLVQIGFLEFTNLFGKSDLDIAAIEVLKAEIRGLSNSWDDATKAKFEYLEDTGSRWNDQTNKVLKLTQQIQAQNAAYAENRRQQVRNAKDRIANSNAKELAEANKDRFRRTSGLETLQEQQGRGEKAKDTSEEDRIKKLADAQNKAWAENRGRIVIDAMEKNAANQKAIEDIKIQREKLAEVGIEAKGIANTISTTWIDGLRQGNSLLEITKNSFKNVLNSIAETLLKKSIEYGVELLFQTLLGNKISKEKEITKEKNKQLAATAAMAALNMLTGGTAGAVSNGVKFFGMNKGGVVPGGAPYTDRIPTMLTPGELVVPRDKANSGSMGGTNITNINISGNVDQRSIDQIKAVITSSSSEVGGANRSYQSNTQGVRGRNK